MIELRGVRVHNLKNFNLQIPRNQLVAITGVSGAGKSSLAFDTLFAEGRRRYVETLSTATRAQLDPIERPEVDFIGQIPPAIAVRQRFPETSRRPTVGTASEVTPLLRQIFVRHGSLSCCDCQLPITSYTPSEAAEVLSLRTPGQRIQVAFELVASSIGESQPSVLELADRLGRCQEAGFIRALYHDQSYSTQQLEATLRANQADAQNTTAPLWMIVDRLTVGVASHRLIESLEQACRYGRGTAWTFSLLDQPPQQSNTATDKTITNIDGQPWLRESWSMELRCGSCRRLYRAPDPGFFNFNQSSSACEQCKGLGVITQKASVNAGEEQSTRVLDRRSSPNEYETHCPTCCGARLKSEPLAWRIGGRSIAAWSAMSIDECLQGWDSLSHTMEGTPAAASLKQSLHSRLSTLVNLGLGYLKLDQPLRTLSSGEAQRVRLAAATATELVHMLYVLDEPSAGLGSSELESVARQLQHLRNLGNSVVIAEHHPQLIRHCDHVIDLGPDSGREGGTVVFQGTPHDLSNAESTTAVHFRRLVNTDKRPLPLGKNDASTSERRESSAWLQFRNVTCRTIRGLNLDLPLGALCVVTGVSGSGKSTLVNDCVYGLVQNEKKRLVSDGIVTGSVTGVERLSDVQLIANAPIARSSRSTPAGYLQLNGQIRQLFAGCPDAKKRRLTAAHFGLHVGSPGACTVCSGLGYIEVDLQFLPDIESRCPECHGRRFREEILEVKYRGLSIADVLDQTAKESLPFFRGQTRIQRKLKLLSDFGLESLGIGRSARTLSSGETQRLRLTECLTRVKKGNCLIVMDEPTRGLHPADVAKLLRGIKQLISAGHSLLIAEHHPDVISAADWLIEMGPGAGTNGGQVVSSSWVP